MVDDVAITQRKHHFGKRANENRCRDVARNVSTIVIAQQNFCRIRFPVSENSYADVFDVIFEIAVHDYFFSAKIT